MEVRGLGIQYRLDRGIVQAVQDVSFQLEKGETLGIVGESGCGKTTIAKALLRILPENGLISQGSILFKGMDLATLDEAAMKDVRWRDISLISQSAMNSLNPVYTVGNQIVEAIQIHEKTSHSKAWERAEEAFALVGLEGKRLSSYPHQLSGGMRQRAVIAMALILRPDLILADEPTTALDVLVQDRILKEIVTIQDKIKKYITDKRLNPGDLLPPEGLLAENLGVSRGSVREAVKSLESLGIVESRRGDGVRVREFNFDSVFDFLSYGLVFQPSRAAEIQIGRAHV